MRSKIDPRLFCLVFLCGLFAACSPVPSAPVQPSGTVPQMETQEVFLTPYQTRTPVQTQQAVDPSSPTPFPTPTATPRTHVVKRGEDLFGIALRYGLSLEVLAAANPEINPNLLSVDTVLVIPASADGEKNGVLPSPTAAAAVLSDPFCSPSQEGGLYCFLSVENADAAPLEGVSAQVSLADSAGVQVADKTALTLLNIVPAGESHPLVVYFPPPVPDPFQVQVVLRSAFPAQSAESQYLPVDFVELEIVFDPDQATAVITGSLGFPQGLGQISRLWIAAAAYDESGSVIGVRRWESPDPVGVASDEPFSFKVYSMGGRIDTVKVFAEAMR